MASYEQTAAEVAAVVTGLEAVSPEVADAIETLLGKDGAVVNEVGAPLTEGLDAPSILTYNNTGEALTDPSALTAPVLIMGEGTTIKVDLGANSPVEAIVVGDGGGSQIISTATRGEMNIALTGGNGDDVQLKGSTDDTIAYNGGEDVTIDAGNGTDVITVRGKEGTNSTVDISQGEGDLTVFWQSDADTAATIDGGAGFDRLQINTAEGRGDHYFTIEDGKAIMHSETTPVTMDNMEIVIFDSHPDNPILTREDSMTIISQNEGDTLVGRLYQIAYGRQPFDNPVEGRELAGIKYWMARSENIGKGDATAKDYDADLTHFVYSFLNTDEFHLGVKNDPNNGMGYDDLSDLAYVQTLYENLNLVNDGDDITTIHGRTAEQYAELIENGTLNRYDVAWQLAASTEANDVLGLNGNSYVIEPWTTDTTDQA